MHDATHRRVCAAVRAGLGLAASLVLAVAAPAQEEEWQRPAEDRTVKGEKQQRYFLIGPAERYQDKAPKDGFRLLLVLPGGTGSADFHSFVRRIAEQATAEEYLVAQLVAPVWDEAQAKQLVWPSKKNPWPGMDFSTEEFLEAVISDVKREHKLDPDHAYALAWSSSGPATYAASVEDRSRLTGVFIAMSVFKPEQMESLKKARSMAYYLYQSPEDTRTPLVHAETARDQLTAAKAEVQLKTYAGGHRWIGDVYGNLREGLQWLEQHHRKPRRR